VNDHAAADRAIRTGRARLGGARDLQFTDRRVSGSEIETETLFADD
jgi:hypothetical protein